jgi:hypothetical protein
MLEEKVAYARSTAVDYGAIIRIARRVLKEKVAYARSTGVDYGAIIWIARRVR